MYITIGTRKVVARSAEDNETVCTLCCFANHGRSTRTCPRVSYLASAGDQKLSSDHLCTAVGEGDLNYFIEAT